MNPEAQFWAIVNEIQGEIQAWIEVRDKKLVFLKFNRKDLIRLFKFRVWSLRYYLTIPEILDIIVPVFRSQVKKKKRRGLGVRISSLTGKGAERILRRGIKEAFPNKDHIALWKIREQEKQLEREKQEGGELITVRKAATVVGADSVESYLKGYKRSLKQDEEWRKKLKYRWNPWL